MRLPTIISLILILSNTGCHSRQAQHNYLFDMGSGLLPVEKGYTRITPADVYSPEKGYGWLTPPRLSYDTANKPLPQAFLKDGLLSADSMVFRADLPAGDYFLYLTLGAPQSDTTNMQVSIDGIISGDSITTPWYRLAYKTLTRRLRVTGGRTDIKVSPLPGSVAGIYALAIRPVTAQQNISFDTPLEEDTAAVSRFASTLRQQLSDDPDNISAANQLQRVENYLLACRDYEGGGWSWAVKSTHMSLIYRLYATADLLEQLVADSTDPLHDKATYLLAKTLYWLNDEDELLFPAREFPSQFLSLKEKYPDDRLIRMYLGEKFFINPDFDTTAGNAPKWAVYEHETMQRLLKVLYWWAGKRQTADGEMGGKYGDDVELLRWWLPAILGADDSLARTGYLRLSDGVWNSDELERGYAKRIDDVEHSAELFRDTHPALFLMDYGDPEYVERCLTSMQNFTNVWTGHTPLGHYHFKSYWLSSTQALSDSKHGIDVALNARAVLPGLWAAWYNGNPTIINAFSAWCKSWVADAQRSDNGKPAGILPSAVSFAEDRIGGNSSQWYDPHLEYDYYQWDHLGHVGELQNELLGMYDLTKDKDFLRPANYCASLMKATSIPASPLLPGSLAWARQQLLTGGVDFDSGDNPMGRVFSMARRLTHSNVYDSLVAFCAEPYNKYQVTRNRNELYKGFDLLLNSLRYNLPLLTNEVKFTDRVYIPGSNLLMGMYTGHFGAGYEYPSLVATWKNTGAGVAIFVHDNNNISLYNFGGKKTIAMRTWQLPPGVYIINKSIDANDDEIPDTQLSSDTVQFRERVNDVSLTLPSRQNILLQIRQIRTGPSVTSDAADIALSTRDITVNGAINAGRAVDISCRIHNIGRRTARQVKAELFIDGKKAGETVIAALEAPNDLHPRYQTVSFQWIPRTGAHELQVRLSVAQQEITRLNNTASLDISIP